MSHALPGARGVTPARAAFLVIAAATLARLGFAALLGLGIDESYMVTAGRVPGLGYFDHPPASWWLSWGAAQLFGSGALAVRLPFIALGAVSGWLMYRLGALLFGARAGVWATAALSLAPVLGLTSASWVLPDGPLDAALLGAALCLAHGLEARGAAARAWWIGAGLCAGLALFSKYSAVLTLAGAFLYLVTQPDHRRWLARPEPWLAVLAAVLVFSPVVIWNATHGWASFAFQGARAEAAHFRPWMPFVVLAGEALFILPWIWVPLMIGFARAIRRGPRAWQGWLCACLGAPPVVLFALIAAWSGHRVLFHWAAPGYLMFFPLLGAEFAARAAGGDRLPRRLLAGTAALLLVLIALLGSQARFGWLPAALGRRLDPQLQMTDWTSLRPALDARGLLPPGTVVGALSWSDAGKLGVALGPDVPVICLNADARQFALARPAGAFAGQNILVLAPRQGGPALLARLRGMFDAVEPLPPVEVLHGGAPAISVSVYRGEGLRPIR